MTTLVLNSSVKMTAITRKYVEQIMESDGEMIVDDVPSLWRKKVAKAFADMLAAGEITQNQYNVYFGLPVEEEEEVEEETPAEEVSVEETPAEE